MEPLEPAPPGFALRMVGLAHTGFERECNEDAVGCFDDNLAVVIDAMGGNAAGSLVPPIMLPVLRESLKATSPSDDRPATAHLAAAFSRVFAALVATTRAVGLPMTGAGAVMGALWVIGRKGAFAHVGDTRCYRWREGSVTQIGSEHSLVREMRDRLEEMSDGVRANLEQYTNIVTRAFFADREPEPELIELELRVGDRFLLCSDGLWRTFDELPPEAILDDRLPFEEALRDVMARGLARPSGDNLSALLAEVVEVDAHRTQTSHVSGAHAEAPLGATELRALRFKPSRENEDEVRACIEGADDVADAWEALASRGIIPMPWIDSSTRRFLGAQHRERVRADELEAAVRELCASGAMLRDVGRASGGVAIVQWQDVAAVPPTLEALAMIAADVEGVERAERLIDEAASRLRPFGHASPERHLWTFEVDSALRHSRWPLNVSLDVVASLGDVRPFQKNRWPGSLDVLGDGWLDYARHLCEADDAWSAETSTPVPRWHGTLRGHPYADLASPFRPLREIVALGYQALEVGLWGRVLAVLMPTPLIVEAPSAKPETPNVAPRPWWRFW